MDAQTITVNSRKYDQSIRRSWKCRLLEQSGSQLVCVGEFAVEVSHPDLGLIKKGTISYEYYWLDRWYSIFRFHEPDGAFRNFYCNINMPPVFENDVLDYVDLDIDVFVWPDSRYLVLDEDEYEVNAVKYGYPDNVKTAVSKTLSYLKKMIENNGLPAVEW